MYLNTTSYYSLTILITKIFFFSLSSFFFYFDIGFYIILKTALF